MSKAKWDEGEVPGVLCPMGIPNLEDELDLRVRTFSKVEALLAIQQHLMEQYGPLYNLKTIKPLTHTSPGVWECTVQAGRLKFDTTKEGTDAGKQTT